MRQQQPKQPQTRTHWQHLQRRSGMRYWGGGGLGHQRLETHVHL